MAMDNTFNIDDIIKKLTESRVTIGKENVVLKDQEMYQLCIRSRDIFLKQDTLLKLQPPLKICGNIAGNYSDLIRLFNRGGSLPETSYLFLGGYISHEKQSVETICLLLAYKIKHPNRIYLLRGDSESNKHDFGFKKEFIGRFTKGEIEDDTKSETKDETKDLWAAINDCFNCLPLAAVVDNKIFCVHGGIHPEMVTSLNAIANIQRPTEVPMDGLIHGLLYLNPTIHGSKYFDKDKESKLITYGTKAVRKFLLAHKLDLMCRAHQVSSNGFSYFAKKKMISLFTSTKYREYNNSGAFLSVDISLACTVEVLLPVEVDNIPKTAYLKNQIKYT